MTQKLLLGVCVHHGLTSFAIDDDNHVYCLRCREVVVRSRATVPDLLPVRRPREQQEKIEQVCSGAQQSLYELVDVLKLQPGDPIRVKMYDLAAELAMLAVELLKCPDCPAR